MSYGLKITSVPTVVYVNNIIINIRSTSPAVYKKVFNFSACRILVYSYIIFDNNDWIYDWKKKFCEMFRRNIIRRVFFYLQIYNNNMTLCYTGVDNISGIYPYLSKYSNVYLYEYYFV